MLQLVYPLPVQQNYNTEKPHCAVVVFPKDIVWPTSILRLPKYKGSFKIKPQVRAALLLYEERTEKNHGGNM